MIHRCTCIPHILLPKRGTDLKKWAVIACDQYTSEPEYWNETEENVRDSPSALRLVLPEVYLEAADADDKIKNIHETMRRYLSEGVFEELDEGVILTERRLENGHIRRGLVMAFDLEMYEYKAGSRSLIRPTEKTVEERIPARLNVRRGACIELPHIMLLIDDPEKKIIEPLFEKTGALEKVYDTELMQGGGHITGWFIPEGPETDKIEYDFESLCDREAFNKKYGCTDKEALVPFAVGDGNHSMAAAKAYWEEAKKGLSEEEKKNHPARYVLAEVVNIHDESLEIHPIHRVVFGAGEKELLDFLIDFYKALGSEAYVSEKAPEIPNAHWYPFFSEKRNGFLVVEQPGWSTPVATIQEGLDVYLESHPDNKIDYIHGSDVVKKLSLQSGNVGFILPEIAKNDIFRGVVFDGVLPRKTFSMGEAKEKRYYMEAKAISK